MCSLYRIHFEPLLFSPYEFLAIPIRILKSKMFSVFWRFLWVFMPFKFYNPDYIGRARNSYTVGKEAVFILMLRFTLGALSPFHVPFYKLQDELGRYINNLQFHRLHNDFMNYITWMSNQII